MMIRIKYLLLAAFLLLTTQIKGVENDPMVFYENFGYQKYREIKDQLNAEAVEGLPTGPWKVVFNIEITQRKLFWGGYVAACSFFWLCAKYQSHIQMLFSHCCECPGQAVGPYYGEAEPHDYESSFLRLPDGSLPIGYPRVINNPFVRSPTRVDYTMMYPRPDCG